MQDYNAQDQRVVLYYTTLHNRQCKSVCVHHFQLLKRSNITKREQAMAKPQHRHHRLLPTIQQQPFEFESLVVCFFSSPVVSSFCLALYIFFAFKRIRLDLVATGLHNNVYWKFVGNKHLNITIYTIIII